MTQTAIRLKGFGNAGVTFVDRYIAQPNPYNDVVIEISDSGVWKEYHVSAGLIGRDFVNVAKPDSARDILIGAGCPGRCVRTSTSDVRDDPRSSYAKGITIAATDGHDTKNTCVMYSLQAGSPAVAIGLGTGEAVVECYAPSEFAAGYCCVHGGDRTWLQRQPCMAPRVEHTTELAWRQDRETVLAAAQLVASIVAAFLIKGEFPGGRAACLRNGEIEWFEFGRDPGCDGLHDSPATSDHGTVVRVPRRSEDLPIDKLLEPVGSSARYADRELAWNWHCRACGPVASAVLHTVHPAARCPHCNAPMAAGSAQASGLDAAELIQLNGGNMPTLATIGLATEGMIRCTRNGSANAIWLIREDLQ